MDKTVFAQLVRDTLAKCDDVLTAKGKDYSGGSADVFVNFKRRAAFLGKSRFEVLMNDFMKHVDSIQQAVLREPNNPSTDTEPLESRIHDGINYLILLSGMIEEARSDQQNKRDLLEKSHLNSEFGVKI